MRKSIRRLHRRIFLNNKKSVLLILVFLCTILILEFMPEYYHIQKEIKKEEGKNLYGSYELTIDNVTKETAQKIAQEKKVADYELYTFDSGIVEDFPVNIWLQGVSHQVFDLSNYKLLHGRFPETAEEVLCDHKFLKQMGYKWEEGKPLTIEISEKSYQVTGEFIEKSIYEVVGVVQPYNFLINLEAAEAVRAELKPGEIPSNYGLYIETNDRDFVSMARHLRQKYQLTDEQIFYNGDYLEYAGINEKNEDTALEWVLYKIVYVCICFLLLCLLYKLILLYVEQRQHDYYILMSCGISPKSIRWEVIKLIGTIYLVLGIVCEIGLYIVEKSYVFVHNYRISLWKGTGNVLVSFVIFGTLLMIALWFRLQRILGRRISTRLDNIESIDISQKKKQQPLNPKHHLVRALGANTIYVKKRQYISFLVLIVMSMLVLIFTHYCAEEWFAIEDNSPHDYRLEYLYANYEQELYGIEGMDETYRQLQQETDLFEVSSLYYDYETVDVRKSAISKEYVDYLKSISVQNNIAFRQIDNQKFSQGVMLVALEDKEWKALLKENGMENFPLQGSECLVVSQIETGSKTIPWGVKKGEEFSFIWYDYEHGNADGTCPEQEFTLTAIGEINRLNTNRQEFYYSPIILISKDLFVQLKRYDYPQIVYLDRKTATSAEMEAYFSDISSIDLVDMGAEKEAVKNYRFRTSVFLYVLIGSLLLLLAINIYIVLMESFRSNKRQLAMLHAIGIEKKKQVAIQFLVYLKLYGMAFFLGNGLSLLACYASYLKAGNVIGYSLFEWPISSLIITNLMVFAVFFVSMLLLRKKIYQMDTLRILSGETN